ncbi:hypothetical protein DRN94_002550 [archaeon]|nr:hypothetical protein [archaeon]
MVSERAVCDVEGCKNPAVRSIATERALKAGLRVRSKGRRVRLCKEHYKEFKKRVKKERQLERWRWMARM